MPPSSPTSPPSTAGSPASLRTQSPFWALLRVVARQAGRAAVQRTAPFYFGLLIVATIIFSPVGMDAADVARWAAQSRPFRLCLWSLWLIGTTPASQAIWSEPALFFLRSLPVPRLYFYAAQGLLLTLFELPWVWLSLRGAGLQAGAGALLGSLAAHCLIVARVRQPLDVMAGVLILAVIAVPVPAPWALPLLVAALWIGLRVVFARAPERDVPAGRARIAGPPTWALAHAYLLSLWRGQPALLWRFLILMFVGGAVAVLAIRNNDIVDGETQATLTLGCGVAPLLLGAAGLCGPLLRMARQAGWLLSVCAISGGVRVRAAVLAVAMVALPLGVVHSAATAWLIGCHQPLRLIAGGALAAPLVSCLAYGVAHYAARGDKGDGERLLLVALGALFCIVLGTWALHEWLLLALLLAAAYALLRTAESEVPPLRHLRRSRERSQGDLW